MLICMKSLKASVKTVGNKALTLLGFASKAGVLAFGVSLSIRDVKSGKAKGVFFAEDISHKSRKELLFYSEKYGVKAFEIKGTDISVLSSAVGRKCGAVAVLDEKFSSPIISYLTSDTEEKR